MDTVLKQWIYNPLAPFSKGGLFYGSFIIRCSLLTDTWFIRKILII